MVKTRTPLLSAGATGTIGDLLTFQRTPRGFKAYKYKKHADAGSSSQLAQRAHYSEAASIWNLLSVEQKQYWAARVGTKYATAYHAFLSWYITHSIINPILFLWNDLTWGNRRWITNG